MTKQLINLGHLSPEQKEETWSTTVSGSQAWMLIHEPYNLIRDKLGVERIHKSKYDIFNLPKLQQMSANAMAQGRHYERSVFDELKFHEDLNDIISKDETYQLIINEYPNMKITCTPDWIKLDTNGNIIKFGDIKCTSAADSEEDMTERYYPQLLHNAYVLGCCDTELDAKGIISRPLYRYVRTITPEALADYEQRLIYFFYCLENNIVDAYDFMVESLETNNEEPKKEVIIVEENIEEPETINDLERLMELKAQESITKKEIENLEKKLGLKTTYENANLTFGNHVLSITTTITKPSLDYKEACAYLMDMYNINSAMLAQFEKPGTQRKTMKFKTL